MRGSVCCRFGCRFGVSVGYDREKLFVGLGFVLGRSGISFGKVWNQFVLVRNQFRVSLGCVWCWFWNRCWVHLVPFW